MSVRARNNYGRFVGKDYMKFVLADLETTTFDIPVVKQEVKIPFRLIFTPWPLCCGAETLHGFGIDYGVIRGDARYTAEQYIEHNVKEAVKAFAARRGQLYAIINKSQKDLGWGDAFIKHGFVLLSAVNNPVHGNRSRIYTYALFKGSNPQVGDTAHIE